MYKKIKKDVGFDSMLDILKDEGVFVIPNYLNFEATKKLSDEVDQLLEKSKLPYKFGKYYRSSNINEHFEINNVFDKSWMKKLSLKYHPNKPYGQSVVVTHEYIKTKDWERQAWLHFDKQNSLKFFMYLNDVTKGGGELTVCPKSHKIGSSLRKKWSDSEYEANRKLEESNINIVNEFDVSPIIEKRGTLIVFDTDTFHKGGIVTENKERKIIRIHNI